MIRAIVDRVLRVVLPIRGQDPEGAGHFGAPRGKRKHEGLDPACFPGTEILAELPGRVVRRGFCYSDGIGGADDPDPFMLLVIDYDNGQRFRYLYVEPKVGAGDRVAQGQVIGVAQDLRRRLPKITPHVHVDAKDAAGNVIHPDDWFKDA